MPVLRGLPRAIRASGCGAALLCLALAGLTLLPAGLRAQPAVPATSQPGAVPSPSTSEAAPPQGTPVEQGATVEQASPATRRTVTQPVWEAGLGLTMLSLPDYRGSDRSRAYLLPVPYLVYRGPRVSVDRGGLKAELLEKGGLQLDFSMNLSVPVRSDGNGARAGMPRLSPALEIGPQLLADLWGSADGDVKLQLQLPLRYAFSLSSSTRDAGFIFHPRLGLDFRNFAGSRGLNAGLVVGPMFATARQHDYFYTVDPQYATATRPAYEAGSGYSGMQLTMSLSKRFPSYWFGAFVRTDWLDGAVFADSPLVRRNTTVSAGVAISWIFAVSADQVSRRD
jgi:outer membrane protein